MRRLVVNACFFLTRVEVPAETNIAYIDAFKPTLFRVIRKEGYYKERQLKVFDFEQGSTASTGLPDDNIPEVWKEVIAEAVPF